MKALLFVLVCVLGHMKPLQTPPTVESEEVGIRATILDYVEGYYTGDAARVERALSPALAKRAFGKRKKDGTAVLLEETAPEFVKLTKSGDGPRSYPEGKRRHEIKIFEVYKNMASAKLVAEDWIDYIHLSKQNGHWVILNVLWTSYTAGK